VHKSGQIAMIRTRGNPDCHIILRGGATPNYDESSVAAACDTLHAAGLPASLMVDCSHANCGKQHERQLDVVREIARQIGGGSRRVFGAMIESHIHAGAQKFAPGRDDPAKLAYGTSITDPCLGWEPTVEALRTLSEAVRRRRG
jgi:3-deoxy-7-phosphoheptulonate synthase